MIRLEYMEDVSHATVRHVMQDNELKPWRKAEWCIRPKQNAEYVYRKEDVLEVYQRPEEARFPLICSMKDALNCQRDAPEHSGQEGASSTL